MPRSHSWSLLSLLLLTAHAGAVPGKVDTLKPEIERRVGAAQADGVVHGVRTIPEACTRLEGVFSRQVTPYQLKAVRTSDRCQPRAQWVDAAKHTPSQASGWLLNDIVRIPSAACATQQAVVRIWRKPSTATPPKLDAQGRSRVYLDDAHRAAKAKKIPSVAMFAAQMTVEGKRCP